MLPVISWFTLSLPEWLTLDANPLDCLFYGLVGACGISVLCNLLRVYLFVEAEALSIDDDKGKEKSQTQNSRNTGLTSTLQFWILAGILAVVGSRVASLIVLEFCLRAVSSRITSGSAQQTDWLLQQLVQCQFSLGCALSCTLHFLHEGALQRWLSLLLATALSCFLARLCSKLWNHVTAMYSLHSSQHYCGVCIGLLTSSASILPFLCCAIMMTFTVAAIAAMSTINQHFISTTDALRFWTPLTICYTLLVVYMQDEQTRQPKGKAILNTIVVRLGGLLILMLTLGRWTDVFHILVCFLGEIGCLLPAQDLLAAMTEDEGVMHIGSAQRAENKRKVK